jgi:lysophospholipase L1-like esterase
MHEGVYHSFSHHSRFSGTDKAAVLEKINTRLADSSGFLRQAKLLIITFGTASVYRLASTGKVVSNCHKLPAREFEEERLTVEQITEQWNNLIRDIRTINPNLKILFTVSPIRHWKNGANANQLSKAVLLLAVDEIIQSNPQCFYFPAYEIVLDDLRDYRFYADDLIHPNSQAIDYIWGKFCDAYFDLSTVKLIREYEKEQKAMNHRKIIN